MAGGFPLDCADFMCDASEIFSDDGEDDGPPAPRISSISTPLLHSSWTTFRAQAPGMRFRRRHALTVAIGMARPAVADRSEASCVIPPARSMMVLASDMGRHEGCNLQPSQPLIRAGRNSEPDRRVQSVTLPGMADKPLSEWTTSLLERTHALRKRSGLTQKDVAEALGISESRYKMYEVRTPIPHEFMVRFCLIVGCTLDELLGGSTAKAQTRRAASRTTVAEDSQKADLPSRST